MYYIEGLLKTWPLWAVAFLGWLFFFQDGQVMEVQADEELDYSSTVSTLNIEWDNKKYLELRVPPRGKDEESLVIAGHLVNAPDHMPAFQDAGGYQVITFAGVTMKQFKSFAKVKNGSGDCKETQVLDDYPSVLCVFIP